MQRLTAHKRGKPARFKTTIRGACGRPYLSEAERHQLPVGAVYFLPESLMQFA
jgi:hypothetical protein